MEICYYYHILDIGILYEKGGGWGKFWRLGERKRLRNEVFFWQKILEFVTMEEQGIDCSERIFEHMEKLCKKYKLPNYERVLRMKGELMSDGCIFEIKREEQIKTNRIMLRLLTDLEKYLDQFKGKAMVFRILAVLHNFPKVMHGKTALNKNCRSISYKTAWSYAQGYMNDEMREEYSGYL